MPLQSNFIYNQFQQLQHKNHSKLQNTIVSHGFPHNQTSNYFNNPDLNYIQNVPTPIIPIEISNPYTSVQRPLSKPLSSISNKLDELKPCEEYYRVTSLEAFVKIMERVPVCIMGNTELFEKEQLFDVSSPNTIKLLQSNMEALKNGLYSQIVEFWIKNANSILYEGDKVQQHKITHWMNKHVWTLAEIVKQFIYSLENTIFYPSTSKSIENFYLSIYEHVLSTKLLHNEVYEGSSSAEVIFINGTSPLIVRKKKTAPTASFELQIKTSPLLHQPKETHVVLQSEVAENFFQSDDEVKIIDVIEEQPKPKRRKKKESPKHKTDLSASSQTDIFTQLDTSHVKFQNGQFITTPTVSFMNSSNGRVNIIKGTYTMMYQNYAYDIQTSINWPYQCLSHPTQWGKAFKDLFHSKVFGAHAFSMGEQGRPVKWPRYANYLQNFFMNAPRTKKNFINERSLSFLELEFMHLIINNFQPEVTLPQSHKFFKWFESILHCICNHSIYPLMWNSGYLFPFMDNDLAESVLQGMTEGTTILRFPHKEDYCDKYHNLPLIVSSVKFENGQKKIHHAAVPMTETKNSNPTTILEPRSHYSYFIKKKKSTDPHGDSTFTLDMNEQVTVVDKQTFLNENPYKKAKLEVTGFEHLL